ncbi:MAG: hypothetical protein AAF614_19210 [Chloroflexota bacterium]
MNTKTKATTKEKPQTVKLTVKSADCCTPEEEAACCGSSSSCC